jgi:MATE family multidrug resistance protein
VLAISLPLAAAMASNLIIQFCERLFLGGYSLQALAAVAPAGQAAFWGAAFFLGALNYLGVFVAQYVGAGRPEQVGAVVWAGVRFSLLAGLPLGALGLAAGPLLAWVGHAPEVRALEESYLRIVAPGWVLGLLGPALGCFFSGRGQTRPLMAANLLGAALYAPLAYALINGWGPLPELGITGAAVAQVAAWGVTDTALSLMIWRAPEARAFGLCGQRGLRGRVRGVSGDGLLLARLLRYGLPSGAQFVVEVTAITCFVLLVGRLGTAELALTNMVMAIDGLTFVPMMGFSTGVSTLVGQAMGAGRPERVGAVVSRTLALTLGYMGLVCLVFLLWPEWLLGLFRPRGMSAAEFAPLLRAGVAVLAMAAFYRLFSGLGIVCTGALRGAGDVRFILAAMAVAALAVLITPLYLGLEVLGQGVYWAWGCFTAYILALSLTYAWRYRRGAWRGLRVVGRE